MKKIFLPLALAIIFFLIAFLTLGSYGISWDEILHFSRGQAYLHYFLTGKTNYNDLPNINLQGTLGKPENVPLPRRSFFQLNDIHNGDFFINKGGGGHPPINDNLAALSNYIFYQKLGIMDDISSYHLFNILASSVLVFIVVMFAQETLGKLSAIVSCLALCTYPLFWSESHFNIKDFPEAAFFAGFIWSFYKSLNKFSVKWLVASIVFFSFALGIKFNVFFAIPIIVIYLVFRYGKNLYRVFLSLPKCYLVILLIAPFIVLGILTISWPFLWHNWLDKIILVFKYYENVGTGTDYQPQSFYIAGFNTFPAFWILFTTPPVTLLLFGLGVISSLVLRKKKKFVYLLWLLWFLIPLIRVTLPGSSIYGGIRQISEFVPAMALLSGLGAYQLTRWFKNNRIVSFIIILVFAWPVFILFKLHPNENVYFNSLIGGLSGAYRKSFPSWGNSLGNAYLQGIRWINDNATKGAKLTLIQGTRLNVPPILVRKDINFSPINFSGINRDGEYLMDLTFNDTSTSFYYAWEYVDKFLIPVYEVKVDGVAILKVWKNDLDHTKDDYKLTELPYTGFYVIKKKENILEIDLNRVEILSRVKLGYTPFSGCTPINLGYVEISQNKLDWTREKDWIPFDQVRSVSNSINNNIVFYLAAKKARAARFVFESNNSCALNKPTVSITILE